MCQFNHARTAGFQPQNFGNGHPGFGRFARHFADWQRGFSNVPVNVREAKDWFEIQVFAPGLNKDAFQVNVSGDLLSVRFQPPTDSSGKENWLHREHANAPFERQFALNGKVDASGIAARYEDGVLALTLPKLPGSAGQEIPVA